MQRKYNDPWDSDEKSEGQEKTLKRSNNASVIEQDWYFRYEVSDIYYLIKSLILAQDERWRHA